MTKPPDFDVEEAHRYFSADCFNKAWDLMDKAVRNSAENEEMICLCLTSLWHWTQRTDGTKANKSIGYWQAARIYAMLGQADNARRYGQLCLEISLGDDVPPFYLGYAYEALARAELTAGNRSKMEEYLKEARRTASAVPDAEAKKQLEADLETIV